MKVSRAVGYGTRFIRDLFVGGDAFWTIAKGIVVLVVGTIALAAFGPIILGATALGGVIWAAFGIKDEMDANAIEDQKEEELAHTKLALDKIKDKLNKDIDEEEDTDDKPDLFALGNAGLLRYTLRKYFRLLGLPNDLNKVNAAAQRKRKNNGRLPGQESLLILAESVLGVKRTDEDFFNKLENFQDQEPDLRTQAEKAQDKLLRNQAEIAFQLKVHENKQQVANDFFSRLSDRINGGLGYLNKTKAGRRIIGRSKDIILVLARVNLATWLGIGTITVLTGTSFVIAGTTGVVSALAAVAWPILLTVIAAAVVMGIAAVIYRRYADKKRKKNNKNTKEALQEKNITFNLLYKLEHLNHKDYRDNPNAVSGSDWNVEKSETPSLDPKIAREQRADKIIQGFYGLAVGIVIGNGSTFLVALLLQAKFGLPTILALGSVPFAIGAAVVTISALGLIIGCAVALRYAWVMYKEAKLVAETENQLRADVQKLHQRTVGTIDQCNIDKYLSDTKTLSSTANNKQLAQQIVEHQLKKSKRILVMELMKAYIDYSQQVSKPKNPSLVSDILSKKEKILAAIEEAAKIKRVRGSDGFPRNDDADFYNNLSYFLQKDPALAGNKGLALALFGGVSTLSSPDYAATLFKSAVLGKQCTIHAPPKSGLSIFFSGAKDILTKHLNRHFLLPILGPMTAAFPLAFAFFAPAVIPALAVIALSPPVMIALGVVFALVMGLAIAHRVLEYRAIKRKKALSEEVVKLSLIKTTKKLESKTDELSQTASDGVTQSASHQRPLFPQKRSLNASPFPIRAAASPERDSELGSGSEPMTTNTVSQALPKGFKTAGNVRSYHFRSNEEPTQRTTPSISLPVGTQEEPIFRSSHSFVSRQDLLVNIK